MQGKVRSTLVILFARTKTTNYYNNTKHMQINKISLHLSYSNKILRSSLTVFCSVHVIFKIIISLTKQNVEEITIKIYF